MENRSEYGEFLKAFRSFEAEREEFTKNVNIIISEIGCLFHETFIPYVFKAIKATEGKSLPDLVRELEKTNGGSLFANVFKLIFYNKNVDIAKETFNHFVAVHDVIKIDTYLNEEDDATSSEVVDERINKFLKMLNLTIPAFFVMKDELKFEYKTIDSQGNKKIAEKEVDLKEFLYKNRKEYINYLNNLDVVEAQQEENNNEILEKDQKTISIEKLIWALYSLMKIYDRIVAEKETKYIRGHIMSTIDMLIVISSQTNKINAPWTKSELFWQDFLVYRSGPEDKTRFEKIISGDYPNLQKWFIEVWQGNKKNKRKKKYKRFNDEGNERPKCVEAVLEVIKENKRNNRKKREELESAKKSRDNVKKNVGEVIQPSYFSSKEPEIPNIEYDAPKVERLTGENKYRYKIT